MSADNGYIIRKYDGFYWLDMYMASSDELPPVMKGTPYSTLEEAVVTYAVMSKNPNFVCEYGLSIDIDGPREPEWARFGVEPDVWAKAFMREVKVYNLETISKWFAKALEIGHNTSNQKWAETWQNTT